MEYLKKLSREEMKTILGGTDPIGDTCDCSVPSSTQPRTAECSEKCSADSRNGDIYVLD